MSEIIVLYSEFSLLFLTVYTKLRKYRLKPVSGPVSVPVKEQKGNFFQKVEKVYRYRSGNTEFSKYRFRYLRKLVFSESVSLNWNNKYKNLKGQNKPKS